MHGSPYRTSAPPPELEIGLEQVESRPIDALAVPLWPAAVVAWLACATEVAFAIAERTPFGSEPTLALGVVVVGLLWLSFNLWHRLHPRSR